MANSRPLPDRCYVSDAPPRDGDPGVPEDYYQDRWCHLSCLNSPAGIAWRESQTRQDPGFARYLRLSTVGLELPCPACGHLSLISAKARGMGAGTWEACCRQCDRVTTFNGYAHPREYARLVAAETEFLQSDESDGWRRELTALALATDDRLQARACECGGHFSLAAEPRCPACRAVLLDSYFHYAYDA